MFLSLIGTHTGRAKARSLFQLKRSRRTYDGATLEQVGRALRRSESVCQARWETIGRFSLAQIESRLVGPTSQIALPTLLYFDIIHRRLGISATHFAVVTSASRDRIELLDPLGRAPSEGSNVTIRQSQNRMAKFDIEGCGYLINTRSKVALLRWRKSNLGTGRGSTKRPR